MWLKRFILCLVFLIRASSSTETDKIEAYRFAKKLVFEIHSILEKMTSAPYDNKILQYIANNSVYFSQLCVPLGSLLSQSLNIENKTDSHEYKALDLLNKDIVKVKNSRKFWTSFMDDNVFNAYSDKVSNFLDVLMEEISNITDPSKDRTSEKFAGLYSNCQKGLYDLKEIAKEMKRLVTEGCYLNRTMVYTKLMNIYNDIKEKTEVYQLTDDERVLVREILKESHKLSTDEALTLLKTFDLAKGNEGFNEMIKKIHKSIKHSVALNRKDICITDHFVDSIAYDSRRIGNFAALMQNEMSSLLIASATCASFKFQDNPKEMETYLTDIGREVKATAQFLYDYIPKKMNMTSQGLEQAVVRSLVALYSNNDHPKNKPLPVSLDSYFRLANYIESSINGIGPASIKNQILVVPSKKSNPEFDTFYVCPEYWCSVVEDIRGVDVIIARYSVENKTSFEQLQRKMKSVEPQITQIIRENALIPLSQLSKKLEVKNIKLTGAESKSAVIVRHRTKSEKLCQYPSAENAYRYNQNYEVAKFDYRHFDAKKLTEDNTCHQFFFIL